MLADSGHARAKTSGGSLSGDIFLVAVRGVEIKMSGDIFLVTPSPGVEIKMSPLAWISISAFFDQVYLLGIDVSSQM